MNWLIDIWKSADGYRQIFGLVAAGIFFAGNVVYILVAARSKEAKPSRTTWWIWAILGMLLTIYYYRIGKNHAFWLSVVNSCFGLAIAAITVIKDYKPIYGREHDEDLNIFAKLGIAIRNGNAKMNLLDRICFGAACLSIILCVTDNTFVALSACIVVDVAAFIPTLRNIWREPRSESLIPWSLFMVANFVNLFAVSAWTWEQGLYPMYFAVGCSIVNIFMWYLQIILPALRKLADRVDSYP